MRKGISRGGFALVLVALMLTLTTMAYASPPDPSWVRGLYDDGDFDNVVGFITSAAGLVEAIIASDLRPALILVVPKVQRAESVIALVPLSARHPRAPPTV